MKKRIFRIVAIIIVLATLFTSSAYAEVQPMRNSKYIDSYCAYLYSDKANYVQVWFEVNANIASNQVGVTQIILQKSSDLESWTPVKTFYSSAYPNMLASNAYLNVSHVDSIVTGGYYYRAGVNIYVENGGSDSRFITTDPIFVKAS